ncbi:MAG: hypothetical protein EON98_10890 [Chitinophagaceae bacterium]|nr:MAG: hypothetical protein EON98_10890 [Chitinophagaceae bacterium]
MRIFPLTLCFVLIAACNPVVNDGRNKKEKTTAAKKQTAKTNATDGRWKGTFSNGMKGAKISFDVDGNELQNLTFEGYWRCDGKLDLTTIGPEKSFTIEDGKVDGVIIEPEDGPAPFRFELHGTFDGETAAGTLKIDNVPAGCTTYKLNWTAERK